MNTLKTSSLCALILCALACSDKNVDANYFNGKVKYFDRDSITVSNVESKVVVAENYGYGMLAVYDSLVVCWNPKFSEHFFRISNVDTGKEIGYFCSQGRGPQDFTSLGPVFQFFKKGEDLMTLAYASNEGKVFFWNISQSIAQNITIFDTMVPIDCKIKEIDPYLNLYFQGEDRLLATMRTSISSETRQAQPDYHKRTIYSDKLLKDYAIYNKEKKLSVGSGESVEELLYSTDAIKPDGSKIVQAMMYLPQINILDIDSGDVIGSRMKNGAGFSLFETETETKMQDKNVYYNSIQADDHYIYATYWGQKQWDASLGAQMPLMNIIHIFDWSGNLVRELKTDRVFFRISLDQVRNRLYTANLETDEVYYLDLNAIHQQ